MGLLSHITALRQKTEREISDLPDFVMRAEQASHNLLHGLHNRKKAGTGESFWQFRDYHHTDRPQDIDWRQSAKSDAVLIKQKELQTAQKTILWCNHNASMDFRSNKKYNTKHDCAKIICLALSLMLSKTDEHVGLLHMKQTGNKERHIQEIANMLFTGQTQHTLPEITTSFPFPRHASFIGIGDFLSPLDHIEEKIHALSSQTKSGIIIQVLDPAEINLPYRGRIDFIGTDGEKAPIRNASDIRDTYQKKITAHINGVRDICTRAHWHHMVHQTDTNIRDTLKHIIAQTGGKT